MIVDQEMTMYRQEGELSVDGEHMIIIHANLSISESNYTSTWPILMHLVNQLIRSNFHAPNCYQGGEHFSNINWNEISISRKFIFVGDLSQMGFTPSFFVLSSFCLEIDFSFWKNEIRYVYFWNFVLYNCKKSNVLDGRNRLSCCLPSGKQSEQSKQS